MLLENMKDKTYPTASSMMIEMELMPTPRYTPAAKIDWAIPRSLGMVKSLNRLTERGTHDPIENAKPILANKS